MQQRISERKKYTRDVSKRLYEIESYRYIREYGIIIMRMAKIDISRKT